MNNITDIPSIHSELVDIQLFLDITCSENIEEVLERGNMLSAYISRTGKLVADAGYHRDILIQGEVLKAIENQAKEHLPATAVKMLIESACKEYNHLYKWCERSNRTATHQLDWCRTMVSNAKSEREAFRGFNTQKSEQ